MANKPQADRQSRDLIDLVTDPAFLKLSQITTRPNMFACLARTYTETWHSMFLAWLLDPRGSHGLAGYPFRLLCRCASHSPWGSAASNWARLAALADADSIDVTPNERDSQEHVFQDKSRPDVLIENIGYKASNGADLRSQVVIEQKVCQPVDLSQLDNYHAMVTAGSGVAFMGIVVAPRSRLDQHADHFSKSSVWTGIDYQILHDGLLEPCLSFPELSARTKFLLGEYIENLRIMKGASMDIIDGEVRDLALQLWEKHKGALQLLAKALNQEDDVAPIAEAFELAEEEGPRLRMTINGRDISGETVPQFLLAYLTTLDHLGVLNEAERKQMMPYASSGRRYFISRSAIHPEGNPFVRPVSFGGWFVEAHKSISGCLGMSKKFARAAGCKVSEPSIAEGD